MSKSKKLRKMQNYVIRVFSKLASNSIEDIAFSFGTSEKLLRKVLEKHNINSQDIQNRDIFEISEWLYNRRKIKLKHARNEKDLYLKRKTLARFATHESGTSVYDLMKMHGPGKMILIGKKN